jgi:outer membrane biosynthesis protein TonB
MRRRRQHICSRRKDSEWAAANSTPMPEIQASRRLVKSPPELWAEVSDAASLARHLGEVGEIRITRLEPETTVAWEGETASGTVALAPAGWGTSVTLTAEPIAAEPETEPTEPAALAPEPESAATPAPEPEPEAIGIEERPEAEPEPTPKPRRGWFDRLFKRRTAEQKPSPTAVDRAAAKADADRAGGAGETISAAPPAESSSPAAGPARSSAEPEPDRQPDPWEAVLTQALDSLGQAHHRPFSRG